MKKSGQRGVPEVKPVLCKPEGFTLVEVVIASAIMMIVFVAVLGVMSYGYRSSAMTENRLSALHVARQTLESLREESYTSPNLTAGTKQLPNNRGNYVVTDLSGGTTKDITVTITWVERWGLQQSVSLTTSLTKSLHK